MQGSPALAQDATVRLDPPSGRWLDMVTMTAPVLASAEGVTARWFPNDDDSSPPLYSRSVTVRSGRGTDSWQIQMPADPATSGATGDFSNGILRLYLSLPGATEPVYAARFVIGAGHQAGIDTSRASLRSRAGLAPVTTPDPRLSTVTQAPQRLPTARPIGGPGGLAAGTPASTPGPGAVVLPEENCGTHWTDWVEDPEADVNPCPLNCSRGERQVLDSRTSDDKELYRARYHCVLPEMIFEQPAGVGPTSASEQRTNCGTMWTGWQNDPESDVNPCPEHCVRGELGAVRRRNVGELGMEYDRRYQCYVAEVPTRAAEFPAPAGALPATTTIGDSQGMTSAPADQPAIDKPVQRTGNPQGLAAVVADGTTDSTASGPAPMLSAPVQAAPDPSVQLAMSPGTVLAVEQVGHVWVDFSFRPVADASGYRLHASATQPPHSVDGPVLQPDGSSEYSLARLEGLLPGVMYKSWITVHYAGGRMGASEQVPLETAIPINPETFTARQLGPGFVRLEWSAVEGARGYIVEGSNLARTQTTNTAVGVGNVPDGQHEWSVVATYGDQGLYNDFAATRTSIVLGAAPSPPAAADSGRYRVTINGIRVNRQTVDNLFQVDGKGDEVYLGIGIDEYGRDLNLLRHDFVETDTFGDKNGFPAPTRILAGRAGDTGGLRSGDVYPEPNPAVRSRPFSTPASQYSDLPMSVWEGQLIDRTGESPGIAYLILAVQIWEWDGDTYAFDDWQSISASDHSVRRGAPADLAHFKARGDEAPQGVAEYGFDIPYVHADNPLAAAQVTGKSSVGDRPVGLKPHPRAAVHIANETSIVFTRSNLENALAASGQAGLPPGVFSIRFQDDPSMAGDLGGDYTVYVQVERLP